MIIGIDHCKKWKCPACKNEKITEKYVVMVRCCCGDYYEEVGDE